MNPDNKACIAELRISVETRCRPDLDDIDSANILSVIESLQSRIAELEAENERLKVENRDSCIGLNDYYGKQLAASQLREIQLREALVLLNEASSVGCDLVDKALSQPTSTEALDAYVAEKVKESTVKIADQLQQERLQAITDFGQYQEAHEQIATITRQRDLAVEAIENLVEQKGRHNTEIAYKRLVKVLSAIKESEK